MSHSKRPTPPRSSANTGKHRSQTVHPRSDDPYKANSKTRDATVCDDCQLVFFAGRWTTRGPALAAEHSGLCPACRRIRDRYPAGTIRLVGELGELEEELLQLVRNVEAHERAEHPLERLMDIEKTGAGLVITTTGLHVARAIASALERRLPGKVGVSYLEENLITVNWTGSGPA